MRLTLILLFTMVFGMTGMAQKAQKEQAKDSIVFFFGAVKLNNDLQVVTPIDSMKVPANQVKQSVFGVNANNRLRILRMAQTELGDKNLRFKRARVNMILTSKGSIKELRAELDRFLNKNKGSVYTLNNFKFVKPTEDKEGPGKKVEVYD